LPFAASFVVAPLRLTIDKLRGPGDWTDPTGTYHSDGLLSLAQLVLEVDASGQTARRRLDPGTGSAEVDGAIFAAIAAADSTAAFLLDSTFGPPGPRHVRLWLMTAVKPPATWASPLFRVAGRVPAHASPIVVRASSMPSYPKAIRGVPTEGDVVLAFEVDEHGEVPESSLRVLRTDDSAFVAPALRSVRETRFEPATEGGCAVRARMQQWVHFKPPRR
jgi:TonB family protein